MTKAPTFSIPDALATGWQITKKEFQLILSLTAIYSLLTLGPDLVAMQIQKNSALPSLAYGVNVAGWLLDIILTIGYIKALLRIYDKKKTSLSQLFEVDDVFWSFIGTNLLSGLAVILGLVLLIIPGIILAIRFQFAPFLVIEHKMRPIEAMKTSWKMTEGLGWQLFLFGLATAAIGLIGFLLFGIGLLIAQPVIWLAEIMVYRILSKHYLDKKS